MRNYFKRLWKAITNRKPYVPVVIEDLRRMQIRAELRMQEELRTSVYDIDPDDKIINATPWWKLDTKE